MGAADAQLQRGHVADHARMTFPFPRLVVAEQGMQLIVMHRSLISQIERESQTPK